MPNAAQLHSAAGGVAYRCEQLGGLALIIGRGLHLDVVPPLPPLAPDAGERLRNSIVDSALVNARALAYFLGATKKPSEVAAADYGATVPPDLSKLANEFVLSPISNHLAHAKYDKRARAVGDVVHPGAWPIPELALILVAGVADVVAAITPARAAWFTPDPRPLLSVLRRECGARRTVRSKNRDVLRLTTELQSYLDAHP